MPITIDNITNVKDDTPYNDYVSFDIFGDKDVGLDKSVLNALRRTIISDIPCVAFRVERGKSDIVFLENKSSLHNEFILDRIALIPLAIDPETYYKKEYLFKLNVKKNPDLDKPILQITSENFEIFKIKDEYKGRDVDIRELDNYERINLNDKDKILNPFKYNYNGIEHKEYCIITELKSNNFSGNMYEEKMNEQINLYGTPSISSARENAAWSVVSNCVYTYKMDEIRFKNALDAQIQIQNVKSNIKEFREDFLITDGERYYYLDDNMRPYYYNFTIEKIGFYDVKDIFIKGCSQLIKRVENFKKDLASTNQEMSRIQLSDSETIKGGHTLMVEDEDDTLGNLVQSHIAKFYIEGEPDDSQIVFCGYRRVHPLENRIMFTLKMKTSELKMIVILFDKVCDDLLDLIKAIKSEAEKKF